ncbi:hypothetical protein HS088_TW07G00151 [Tripterygium wilfordii]|uniref:Uncharacterized protein n=1 Tax=Tripterygium wilfordii TaxID=458696 RepID=A0A7J7DET0_TRIWF|nr:hypothetical protein HS088_TW07G00151 [Tripterygium wilfordii]
MLCGYGFRYPNLGKVVDRLLSSPPSFSLFFQAQTCDWEMGMLAIDPLEVAHYSRPLNKIVGPSKLTSGPSLVQTPRPHRPHSAGGIEIRGLASSREWGSRILSAATEYLA